MINIPEQIPDDDGGECDSGGDGGDGGDSDGDDDNVYCFEGIEEDAQIFMLLCC